MQTGGIDDLEAFAAVAAARGFRGAAKVGGVSASALSEAIRRLEARFGVRLLHRTTRSVTPTEEGRRLLERVAPAIGELRAACDAVGRTGDRPTGTLRLNVPVVVATIVLPPILSAFLTSHPGIAAEVVADDNFVDVLAAGFDAGVRYDERLEQDMIATPIGPRTQRYVTAASPAYFEQRRRPTHPRELLDHPCIRHRFRSGLLAPWEFERGDEVIQVEPRGPLVATFFPLQLDAAIAGVGIVHTFDGFLAPAIAEGRLEPVLEDWSPSFSGPFLYYAGRRHLPLPLRAFVDFLKRHPPPAGLRAQAGEPSE